MNDDLFKKLTVLGAGTMGQGIAHVCAAAGMQTVLYDVDLSTVERGLERIRARLDKGVSLGKVTEDDREATLDRITRSSDLALAVEGTPFVIEAAPESMELKQRLFRMVEQRVGEDTILATNTSSISISQLSTGMEFPARFLGMHFFNPVHIMKLLDGQPVTCRNFLVAVFIAYGLLPLIELQVRQLHLPRPVAVCSTLVFGGAVLSGLGLLVSTSVSQLQENADGYQLQIEMLVEGQGFVGGVVQSPGRWLERLAQKRVEILIGS